jgi:hypothetical protein
MKPALKTADVVDAGLPRHGVQICGGQEKFSAKL